MQGTRRSPRKAVPVSERDLSRWPRNLQIMHGKGNAWHYEEKDGFSVVVQPQGVTLRIPLKMMRDFLRRLDQKAKP